MSARPQTKAKPAPVNFQWDDPFMLDEQLTEDERMIRDTARAYAQDKLLPRGTQAYLEEKVDRDIFHIGLGDARQQLVLRIGARGVADHALVFGELLVEQERIVPLEIHRGGAVLGLRAHAHENSFRIIVFILVRPAQKRK